uniref:Uncharacterized protein n=1 Tax=Meloidogyne enterolobii TaxID=390850 RepID=A0A6V7XEN5_MELEN|nr:unnamed protein product [Meloidogyne enterolobii]
MEIELPELLQLHTMDEEYRWLLYQQIIYRINKEEDEIKLKEDYDGLEIYSEKRISLSLLLTEFYKFEKEFLEYSKQTDIQKGNLFKKAEEFVKILRKNIFENFENFWIGCLIIRVNIDLKTIRIEPANNILNILSSYDKKLKMNLNQCKIKTEDKIIR